MMAEKETEMPLCRNCGETLHGHEIAIGVCTDCIAVPPVSSQTLKLRPISYGTTHSEK